MSEMHVDDPNEWKQLHVGFWRNGWKICLVCEKFEYEDRMTKVEPPGEAPYYLCEKCRKQLERIFEKNGVSVFRRGS